MVEHVQWLWNNSLMSYVKNTSYSTFDYIYPYIYSTVGSRQISSQKIGKEALKATSKAILLNSMHIPSSARLFVRLAGLSGALAVALGAYGAHVFYQRDYPEELKQVYETANRYHFLHSLALIGVPLCKRPMLVGSLIACGTLVFSGTCYYYALTGSRSVRQFTPYGGMLLIFGWLAMLL